MINVFQLYLVLRSRWSGLHWVFSGLLFFITHLAQNISDISDSLALTPACGVFRAAINYSSPSIETS